MNSPAVYRLPVIPQLQLGPRDAIRRSTVQLLFLFFSCCSYSLPIVIAGNQNQGSNNLARECGNVEGAEQNIFVPCGNKPVVSYAARGVQIYRFNGTSYNLVNASANIYTYSSLTRTTNNAIAGRHFYTAGPVPTWEVYQPHAIIMAEMRKTFPQPQSIPWILLQVVNETVSSSYSANGSGFPPLSYIFRRSTEGGLASPILPKSQVDDIIESSYSAVYDFYTPI